MRFFLVVGLTEPGGLDGTHHALWEFQKEVPWSFPLPVGTTIFAENGEDYPSLILTIREYWFFEEGKGGGTCDVRCDSNLKLYEDDTLREVAEWMFENGWECDELAEKLEKEANCPPQQPASP